MSLLLHCFLIFVLLIYQKIGIIIQAIRRPPCLDWFCYLHVTFIYFWKQCFITMFCWSFPVLNDGDHTLLCCSLTEIKNSDMLPMQYWYSASKINFPYEKNWTLAVVWGETYRPIHIYFIYKKPSNKIRSLHLILTCMNCARSARTSLSHLSRSLCLFFHILSISSMQEWRGQNILGWQLSMAWGLCESQSLSERQM